MIAPVRLSVVPTSVPFSTMIPPSLELVPVNTVVPDPIKLSEARFSKLVVSKVPLKSIVSILPVPSTPLAKLAFVPLSVVVSDNETLP